LTIDTPDAGGLSETAKSILGEDGVAALKADIVERLVPNLAHLIKSVAAEHDGKEDPEEMFSGLHSAFSEFTSEFGSESGAGQRFCEALADIEAAIESIRERMGNQDEDDEDRFDDEDRSGPSESDRSIFDDVDDPIPPAAAEELGL
jgi:hypothetical protein